MHVDELVQLAEHEDALVALENAVRLYNYNALQKLDPDLRYAHRGVMDQRYEMAMRACSLVDHAVPAWPALQVRTRRRKASTTPVPSDRRLSTSARAVIGYVLCSTLASYSASGK